MGKRVGAKNDQSIMPPIADFDFSFRREDWSNVIACHDGNSQVSTWSTKRRCLTENFLKHKCLNKLVKTFPTCVAMSESGDFGFIGYSNGMLHKYNMQSSLFRGAFERGSTASAHDGAVTGICTHMINNLLISSGKDNLLRFWNFNSAIFVGSLMLEETGTKMLLNRDNLLLAIVQKGGRIVIVNVKTRKLARVLEDPESSINDISFTNNGYWLVSACDDSINIWDVASGELFEKVPINVPCTSISFSLTSQLCATTHKDRIGVYMWSNKSIFSGLGFNQMSVGAKNSDDVMEVDELEEKLCKLSMEPEHKWHNLRLIDKIRDRNKPKEAPKLPKSAPFFLPTVSNTTGFDFDVDTGRKLMRENNESVNALAISDKSAFHVCLLKCQCDGDYLKAFQLLKISSAANVSVQIRSLNPEFGGSIEALVKFVGMLDAQIREKNDIELVWSYFSLFLATYRKVIQQNSDLGESVRKLDQSNENVWAGVRRNLEESLAVANYLRSVVM